MGERGEGRHNIKPDSDTQFECPKRARVSVINRSSPYFGEEGEVVDLGRNNKFVRRVKLDGIPGVHVFILRELKKV